MEVIVKKDQPIWPEWTGEDSAETIDGEQFLRVNGEWTSQAQPAIAPAPTPEGWKAA